MHLPISHIGGFIKSNFKNCKCRIGIWVCGSLRFHKDHTSAVLTLGKPVQNITLSNDLPNTNSHEYVIIVTRKHKVLQVINRLAGGGGRLTGKMLEGARGAQARADTEQQLPRRAGRSPWQPAQPGNPTPLQGGRDIPYQGYYRGYLPVGVS